MHFYTADLGSSSSFERMVCDEERGEVVNDQHPAVRYAVAHMRSDSAAYEGLRVAESRRLALRDLLRRFITVVGSSDVPEGPKREAYFDLVEGLEK